MDEEEVLRLTKAKLQTIKLKKGGLSSLENLAVRDIFRKLMYYTKFPERKESLRKLPRVLREKLLQELLRRKCNMGLRSERKFKVVMEVFQILLSSRTRSIELNGILSFCPDRYHGFNYLIEKTEELLVCTATLAPNINQLIIQRNHAIKMKIEPQHRTLKMLEMMSKMLNLNRLFVELYSFQLSEMLNLCKNLQNLQFLNVRLRNADIHPSAEEIKSSLFNVKEFVFESTGYDMLNWLRSLCIQNLPKIEVVQFYCNACKERERKYIYRRYRHLCSDREQKISSLGFTETSNLRHLYVDVENSEFNIDALPDMFPNVTDLMVDCHYDDSRDKNIDSLLRFSKIKCLRFLEMGKFPLNVQQRFWQAYGENLQTLVLSHEDGEYFVDFNSIFKQCPNLKKISLLNINIEPKQIEFFADLKELEWKFRDISRVEGNMDLSSLLIAPKLEILSIDGWEFDEAGIRKVIAMIQNKEILTQLQTFQLHTHHEEVTYDDAKLRDLLFDLVKSSSVFLPQLTNVKFFSSNDKLFDIIMSNCGFGFDSDAAADSGEKYKSKDPLMVYEKYQDDDIYADECILRVLNLFEST